MSEYYVWNDQATAQAALNYINGTTWFPLIGYNAATGQPQPDKQTTTKWADNIQERRDGKWCFPRISSTLMDAIGVPAADRQAFLNAFNPSIEVYQDDWFLFSSSSSS